VRASLLLIVAGCAATTSPTNRYLRLDANIGTATRHDVRVLVRSERSGEHGPFLATSENAFVELWQRFHQPGLSPRVDFTTTVIIAHSYMGDMCEATPRAIHVAPNGFVTFESERYGRCRAAVVANTIIVAVPRAALPSTFVWFSPEDRSRYRFVFPAESYQLVQATRAVPHPIATVALPPPNHLAKRTTPIGPIWVAHREEGDITILAAENLEWDSVAGEFVGGYDTHGRASAGSSSAGIPLLDFEREGDQLRIGSVVTQGGRGGRSLPETGLVLKAN
jgi:hypothetical protein